MLGVSDGGADGASDEKGRWFFTNSCTWSILIAWLGLKLGISDDIADGKFDDENDGLVLIASPGLGSKLGRALGLSNMREVGASIKRADGASESKVLGLSLDTALDLKL